MQILTEPDVVFDTSLFLKEIDLITGREGVKDYEAKYLT